MFYRLKKKILKKRRGGAGGGVVRLKVKNLKSPNGTETNQLTIYKRRRGLSRVIQILIRLFLKF